MRTRVIAAVVSLLIVPPVTAAPAEVDFMRDVRPIFETRCHGCHGATRQRSGLRLDLKSGALKGGDAYGPAIVPGKAAASPLIRLVTAEDGDRRMPPKGDRLSAAEVAALTTWIDRGAPWPEGADRVSHDDRRAHWSFRPLTRPVPPETADRTWPCNPMDRFVVARLEAEGLHLAPEVDRAAWLRRVTLDLTGLPPTPEQVSAFVGDPRPDAHERVVDVLLASPRYGERRAQQWLDVVRYADTHGFEVNTERSNEPGRGWDERQGGEPDEGDEAGKTPS
jgi:mono/diheme cytochrome c family protein